MSENNPAAFDEDVPVIDLRKAPGSGESWDRPKIVVYLWGLAEQLLVTNPLQVSSALRIATLRAFGAKIGQGVIFRPRTRVRFPWKLEIGEGSWIGEGVWIHNQDHVIIKDHVVLSQEAFITTGSHALRTDMALITSPVKIDSGAWITTRSIILGGTHIGRSAVVTPNSVIPAKSIVEPNTVWTGNPAVPKGQRFPRS